MPNDDELKAKVEKLEKEIEELKRQLADNSAKDKKHHEELKEIQKTQHKENLTWNRTGAIITPLAVAIVPLLLRWFDSRQDIKPAIKKDADDISDKMTKILKALEDKKDKE